MRHDYANFGFDRADVIVCVGYDLQEYAPEQINPDARKKIIHIHRYPAEVDAHYHVAVGIEGNISQSLDALASALEKSTGPAVVSAKIRALLRNEIDRGANDDSFPVKPQRLVADIRRALGRDDIVLVDTGAVKMWMARLYPTYAEGFRVSAAAQLLPTLRRALAGDAVSLVVCPVDYSENVALTKMLGEITNPF